MEPKTAAVAAFLKLVIDVLKAAVPALRGRYTQAVVLVLAVAGAYAAVGIDDITKFLVAIPLIFFAAIGVDQVFKREV